MQECPSLPVKALSVLLGSVSRSLRMRSRSLFLVLLVAGACVHAVRAAETLTYTYDARGRLTKVEASGGPGNGAVRAYQFDAAGNRMQFQSTAASGGSAVAITPTGGVANVTSTGVVIGVSITGVGSPSGIVTFTENGVFLGSAFVYANQASVILEGLPTGVHTITASYSGDGSNAPRTFTFTIKVQDLRWLPAVLDLILSE